MILVLILVGLCLLTLYIIAKAIEIKSENNEEYNYNYNQYPYKKRKLLTENELLFYKELSRIAEKYNYAILTKIRLADIVEVDKTKTNEYMKYFGKIKSKHVDFALANKTNLQPILIIELDDKSHKKEKAQKNDIDKNNILYYSNIKLLRVYSNYKLEEYINDALEINEENTEDKFEEYKEKIREYTKKIKEKVIELSEKIK